MVDCRMINDSVGDERDEIGSVLVLPVTSFGPYGTLFYWLFRVMSGKCSDMFLC